MSDLKICKMGHYYQNDLEDCPYCPTPYRKDENTTFDIAPTHSPSNSDSEKTQLFAAPPPENISAPNPPSAEKTRIVFNQKTAPKEGSRKLVGWLVTFNHFPEGKDFKIYEGRNSIGSQNGNDIVIDFDNTISSRHLTILFRANEFLFQDELSTNGTYQNGELKSNGILSDGDIIKISETEFLFRKAF